ncbi:MAG: hypothetical protein KFH98_07710 [Gemmatimonadetes bacterium]|nr:hypothetical protein [Gemmatimonadota bacterium]
MQTTSSTFRSAVWPAVTCLLLAAAGASACNSVRYAVPAITSGSDEREQVISLPPLDLGGHTDHGSASQPAPLHVAFSESGWMHGFSVEAVDAHGDLVPLSVLHHIKVLMPHRRELFMPIALRLVGAGAETRSGRIPQSMGVPFAAGDSLIVTAMVHNPAAQAYHGVRIRVQLHYTPEPARSSPDAVYPFFLHVTAPDMPSDYDLPPGYSERSWEARPAAAGHIIALGGHLHRFGISLRFEDLTTGREIWRTTPDVDSLGNVLGVPRKVYRWTRGPRLHPDRAYRVTAAYFNPTADTIRSGGMGTLGGVFRPDAGWPALAAGDPIYIMDLEREIGGHHATPARPGDAPSPGHHH